jgi:hypothetical protein
MESGSTEPQRRNRQFRGLIVVALISGLAICSVVEPMRWHLPVRYPFQHLDIRRTGFMDYTMCMRAGLTRSEAADFVARSFAPKDQVSQPVPMAETMCPEPFWPSTFRSNTLGLKIDYWPNGWIEGSTGAVYENGFLYFWSNTK